MLAFGQKTAAWHLQRGREIVREIFYLSGNYRFTPTSQDGFTVKFERYTSNRSAGLNKSKNEKCPRIPLTSPTTVAEFVNFSRVVVGSILLSESLYQKLREKQSFIVRDIPYGCIYVLFIFK